MWGCVSLSLSLQRNSNVAYSTQQTAYILQHLLDIDTEACPKSRTDRFRMRALKTLSPYSFPFTPFISYPTSSSTSDTTTANILILDGNNPVTGIGGLEGMWFIHMNLVVFRIFACQDLPESDQNMLLHIVDSGKSLFWPLDVWHAKGVLCEWLYAHISTLMQSIFCFTCLSASCDESWRYVVVCTLYTLTDSYSSQMDRMLTGGCEDGCRVSSINILLYLYCIQIINISVDLMQSEVYACVNSKYLHQHNLRQWCTITHICKCAISLIFLSRLCRLA